MVLKHEACKEKSSTITMFKERLWITWYTREHFWVDHFAKSF